MGKEFNQRYWITKKQAEDLTKLANAMYAESHPEAEINNPKPLFEALGIKKPLSMEEKIDRLFRGPRGIIEQLYEQGEETPEEMNDLDIDDDVDPISPYEFHIMTEETKRYREKTQSEDAYVVKKSDQSSESSAEKDASEAHQMESDETK